MNFCFGKRYLPRRRFIISSRGPETNSGSLYRFEPNSSRRFREWRQYAKLWTYKLRLKEVLLPGAVYVIEFKTAANLSVVGAKRSVGEAQIADRGDAEKYAADSRSIVTMTFVIDLEKRQAA